MYRAIKNIPMVRSFHGYNQEKKYQRQVDSPADEQELSAELNFQAPIQQQFSPGDHVYQWRCIGLAQKHAIVTTAKDDLLIITDFYPNRIAGSKKKSAPRLLLKEIEQKEWSSWKKVQYDAGFLARNIHRSGTCTSVPSDFSRMILARVRFLLDHDCNQDDSAALPSIIPSYHVLKSNSECVAVWCTTGRWTTLQASSFLHTTIAGQAKSTATVALYAANQTVTVPSSGIWGYLGYTTQVSLISTQPYIIPALASYGAIALGGLLWIRHRYRKHWSSTTSILNDLFWSTADIMNYLLKLLSTGAALTDGTLRG